MSRKLPAHELRQLCAVLALVFGGHGPEVCVAGAREDGAHGEVVSAEAPCRFVQRRCVGEDSLRVHPNPLLHPVPGERHHEQLFRFHREVTSHGVLERLAVPRRVQALHDGDFGVAFAHQTLCQNGFVRAQAGDGQVGEEDFTLDGAEGDGFERDAEVARGFLLERRNQVALCVQWVLLADCVDGGAIPVGENRDECVLVSTKALAGFVDDVDVGGGDDGWGYGRGGVVDWWWGLLILLGRAAVGVGGLVLRLAVVWGLRRVAVGVVAGELVGGLRWRGIVAAGVAAGRGELLGRVAALEGVLLLRRIVLRWVLLVLLRWVWRGILLLWVIAAIGWVLLLLLLWGITGGRRVGPVAAWCGVAARGGRLVREVAVLWVRHDAVVLIWSAGEQ